MVESFAGAFLLTQVIEVPIYAWRVGGRLWRRILVAFAASAITHPIVWFVFPLVSERAYVAWVMPHHWFSWPARWLAMVMFAEGFAVVVEALFLRLMRAPKPLRLAFFANAASFLTGILLQSSVGPTRTREMEVGCSVQAPVCAVPCMFSPSR